MISAGQNRIKLFNAPCRCVCSASIVRKLITCKIPVGRLRDISCLRLYFTWHSRCMVSSFRELNCARFRPASTCPSHKILCAVFSFYKSASCESSFCRSTMRDAFLPSFRFAFAVRQCRWFSELVTAYEIFIRSCMCLFMLKFKLMRYYRPFLLVLSIVSWSKFYSIHIHRKFDNCVCLCDEERRGQRCSGSCWRWIRLR